MVENSYISACIWVWVYNVYIINFYCIKWWRVMCKTNLLERIRYENYVFKTNTTKHDYTIYIYNFISLLYNQ